MKNRWCRPKALMAVVAASGLLCGLTVAQAVTGGLIADGDPPDVFLLYTGDVIGHLDPCG